MEMAFYRQASTSKTLPDILTPTQVGQVLNQTKQLRYQVFFLTLYSMGLRLS
jgi:site-specific recombinase XerD